jgi:hypothetical protein
MDFGIYIDMDQPEKIDCSEFGEVENLRLWNQWGGLFQNEAA